MLPMIQSFDEPDRGIVAPLAPSSSVLPSPIGRQLSMIFGMVSLAPCSTISEVL
jgi:hypothetical protein